MLLLAPAMFIAQLYVFAPGFAVAKRTVRQMWVSIASALAGILANFLLIPVWGITGAADRHACLVDRLPFALVHSQPSALSDSGALGPGRRRLRGRRPARRCRVRPCLREPRYRSSGQERDPCRCRRAGRDDRPGSASGEPRLAQDPGDAARYAAGFAARLRTSQCPLGRVAFSISTWPIRWRSCARSGTSNSSKCVTAGGYFDHVWGVHPIADVAGKESREIEIIHFTDRQTILEGVAQSLPLPRLLLPLNFLVVAGKIAAAASASGPGAGHFRSSTPPTLIIRACSA